MAMTLVLVSCRAPMQAPTPTPEVVPLYFVASSSTHPLLNDLASAYTRDNALVAIINQTTTGITLKQILMQPQANDVAASYALTTYLPDEMDLWAAALGTDGIAIIGHPALAVSSLTAGQLRAIFSGTAENWRELGGSNQVITVVSREATSPSRQAFDAQVLGLRPTTLRARLATTPGAMLDIVSQTPGAVGYISMALVDQRVSIIAIHETESDPPILPTPQSVASSEYPLRMPILVVGSQEPAPGDGYYEFILWAQQDNGQSIIAARYAPLP
ncbi:MAG: hypothetical protein GYB66_14370 [Chloroflexi bacterium]|nr:hypothetical protein [Chloroflexota bacterium]